MRVLLIVSALLIGAGAVSLAAAVMGNPIRIGRTRFPGPESSIERAVIGVLGAVCLVAIIPAFIMGAAHDRRSMATAPLSADLTSPPELVVTTTDPPVPTTTPTPEPPAGPSTAPSVPGKPTVTSIVVSGGAATGCSRPFSGIVHVSNGPVTVRYRIYVDGAVVGSGDRTRTVTGDGPKSLDSVTVAAGHSGAIKVRYDVLAPNPTLLTGSTTWVAPPQCQPVGPTTPVTSTTTPPTTSPTTDLPPPVQPTLSVSVAGAHTYTGSCETAPSFTIGGSVTIGVGSGVSLPVGWNFSVESSIKGSGTVTAPVGQLTDLPTQTVTLSDTSPGDHTIGVAFSATSPDTVPGTDQKALTITVTCN